MKNLEQFLQKNYGFAHFKDGQKEVIEALLQQKSVLGLLPTGTGKSLCYQFFGRITQRSVLIICPLLSLMQDQVQRLRQLGEKKVVAINSNLDFNDRQYVLQNLWQYQYVFLAPEILQNQAVISALKKIKWGLLVVDEAHCIAQWGPDFRPDYLQLGNLKKQLNNPLILALSATVTAKAQQEILQCLKANQTWKIVKRSVDRPNIYLGCEKFQNNKQKEQRLFELVSRLKGTGLIYFSSKKKVEEIAQKLNSSQIVTAAAYHADLSSIERYKVQQSFLNNQIQVVCATSAFGMGIDKKDLRYVIHYHFPADLESYVQEIGRAGRDGQMSLAWLLYTPKDILLQDNLIQKTLPNEVEITNFYTKKESSLSVEKQNLLQYYRKQNYSLFQAQEFFSKRFLQKRQLLKKMEEYISSTTCRRKYILDYFGDQTKIKHTSQCCQIGDEVDLTNFISDTLPVFKAKQVDKNFQDILDKLFFK